MTVSPVENSVASSPANVSLSSKSGNNPVTPLLSSVESNARTYARRFTATFASGDGLYLTDVNGVKYLDMLQCAGALPLGHNHPVLREAILEYLDSHLPQQALDMSTTAKQAFVSELWNWFPQAFRADAKIQFCSPSGSDAIEAAMKLVRIATGRSTIIAFDGGYHGHTAGALAAMGSLGAKAQLKTGALGDVAFFPYPHPDYSPFGISSHSGDQTAELSIKYLERKLADPESGINKPAGIVVECIQGEGGVVPAPVEWLKELRRIATEYDVPLIFDEVQSGFARSGTGFAFEYAGVIPDVLVMSKAVGGSQPLACIAYHSRLDLWHPGSHAGTFRGSQLSLLTGARVLRYMRENDLAGHAKAMGEVFKTGFFESVKALGPKVEERVLSIRGRGLMLGIQLVQAGGRTKDEDGELAARVQTLLFDKYKVIIERGGRHGSVLRVLPPLTINQEEVTNVARVLADAIRESL